MKSTTPAVQFIFKTSFSENRRGLEKERCALCGSLPEGCGSSLIRDLDRPKRRQIAIHKQRLDVVALDSGVSLKEDPQKQVLREELVAYQRGTAAFGQRSTQGNTLFLK